MPTVNGYEVGPEANLSGANLSYAGLSGADLTGANLINADLSYANLSYANLWGAYLFDANLTGADLSKANLSGANLYYADLSDADLSDADLFDANLSGANLSGANLSYANLYDADLSGAFLTSADLSNANLNGALVDQEVWNLLSAEQQAVAKVTSSEIVIEGTEESGPTLTGFGIASPIADADGNYAIEYTASSLEGVITEANFLFYNTVDDIYYSFNDSNGDGLAISDSFTASGEDDIFSGTYDLLAVSLTSNNGIRSNYMNEGDIWIEDADGNNIGHSSHDLTFGDLLLGTTNSDNSDLADGFDDLWGTSGDDVIYMLAGDDVVHGTMGNDTIIGGAGEDHIVYTHSGLDHVWINASDTFWQDLDANTVTKFYEPNIGDVIYEFYLDSVNTNDDLEALNASEGDDTIIAGANTTLMVGNAGNDFIDASRAEQGVRIVADDDDDEVIGSSYADSIDGGSGSDILYGGAGDDTYVYRFDGADVIDDESGNDTLSIVSRPADGTPLLGDMYFDDANQLIIEGHHENAPDAIIAATGIENLYWSADDNSYDPFSTVIFNESIHDLNDMESFSFIGTHGKNSITTNTTDAYTDVFAGDGDDVINISGSGFCLDICGWRQR